MKPYFADNIVATVERRERQATLNAAAAEKLLTLAAAVRTLPDDDPRVTEIVGFWDRLEANDLGRRWSEMEAETLRSIGYGVDFRRARQFLYALLAYTRARLDERMPA